MKRPLAILLVVIVAAGVFLYYPRATGTSAANAATIAVFKGDVDSQHGSAAFEPALDGDVIAAGDVVRANSTGRAVLSFFDGSSLTLEPGALVKVNALARTAGDGLQVDLEQVIGTTWASVEKLKTPDSKFQLKTPTSTAVVRGTSFVTTVEVVNGQTITTIRTAEGEVVVQAVSGGPPVTVGANQQTQVTQNAPASPPVDQPPTPRLRFTGTAGIGFVVSDPRGLSCGSTGGATTRQIPRCIVTGGVAEIGDVVAGTYTMVLTAAQAAPNAQVQAEGFRGQTRDFGVTFTRTLALGDLVRTSLPITIAAGTSVLGSSAFGAAELVTSVCGAEAVGRVFSAGTLVQRETALRAFALASKGQAASFVALATELTAEADSGLRQLRGSPVTVTGMAITADNAGLHLTATAVAGPITVPAKSDIIAGASGGTLLMKVRALDLGPVLAPVKDQLIGAIERSLNDFAASLPLAVDRVTFRRSCMAISGTTR
ncbi:MAG: hypothetical protein EXR61_04675 [Chloroflexi bacterium]|nr:hypothetical protein [Chloroflexota bacterium]